MPINYNRILFDRFKSIKSDIVAYAVGFVYRR